MNPRLHFPDLQLGDLILLPEPLVGSGFIGMIYMVLVQPEILWMNRILSILGLFGFCVFLNFLFASAARRENFKRQLKMLSDEEIKREIEFNPKLISVILDLKTKYAWIIARTNPVAFRECYHRAGIDAVKAILNAMTPSELEAEIRIHPTLIEYVGAYSTLDPAYPRLIELSLIAYQADPKIFPLTILNLHLSLSASNQLEPVIAEHPMLIEFVSSPSDTLAMIAVRSNPDAFQKLPRWTLPLVGNILQIHPFLIQVLDGRYRNGHCTKTMDQRRMDEMWTIALRAGDGLLIHRLLSEI